MPISFQCGCGRKIRTADENAGLQASCPACGVQVMVPSTDAAAPLREAAPPEEEGRGFGYNLQSEEVTPTRRRPAADDYDRDDRRAAPRQADAERFIRRPAPVRRGWTDGGVLAGLGMMLLGVLITVGGLAVGWIIFPGPILFVAGVICLVKGVASGKV